MILKDCVIVERQELLLDRTSLANARPSSKTRRLILFGLLILLLALTAACRQEPPTGAAETPPAGEIAAPQEEAAAVPTAIPSPTSVPPTPTPTEPMAALVNGQPVFLADYDRELARYVQATEAGEQGGGGAEETPQAESEVVEVVPEADATPEVDHRTQVLDALIERELILQAAAAAGVIVDPTAVETRIEELRASAGEAGNFDAWLEANLYTEEEFREALAAEMVTVQMVDLVTAAVPQTIEQVRARYIQVNDLALAQDLINRIRNGDDFAFLAQQNSLDRVTGENGGDLGFFAPGSLLVGEVEAAAFALQPGETSDVITATGTDGLPIYYIVQVTERDPNRAVTADMRYSMLQQTFGAWLDTLWSQATIERFVGQ
jgi:parvulin-like peptidyl-prolyl isomerase